MFDFGCFMVMLQSCVDNFRDGRVLRSHYSYQNFDMLIKYQGPVH